jgi:alpha-glucosidase
LGNHDQMRIASRLGPAQARVAMVLLLTLRGTPTVYNGDELGLENVPIRPEQARDPFGLAMPGTGQGRDPERTPMPWDTSVNCGFTTGEPWLPLGEGRAQQSVAVQKDAPGSMLTLTHALLELRRQEPALATGDFAPLEIEGEALAYTRSSGTARFAVILNLEPRSKVIRWREELGGRVALSTHPERTGRPVADRIELAADEAVVIAPDQKNVRIASVTA